MPDSRGVEGERGGHGGEEDGSSRGEGEGEDMNEETEESFCLLAFSSPTTHPRARREGGREAGSAVRMGVQALAGVCLMMPELQAGGPLAPPHHPPTQQPTPLAGCLELLSSSALTLFLPATSAVRPHMTTPPAAA